MALVSSSVGRRYRCIGLEEDEAPTEHVDSKGKELIKELVKKQTNTQTSLSEQLKIQKDFTKATSIIPLENYSAGQSSLEQFTKQTRHLEFVQELESCGLSKNDLQLAINLQQGEHFLREKHKKAESSAFDSRLIEVKAQLVEKNDFFSTKKEDSYERELVPNVKPQSEISKLLQFVQSSQPPNIGNKLPPDHPSNQLPQIEKELFGHLQPKTTKRKRKKSTYLTKYEDVTHSVTYAATKTNSQPVTKTILNIATISSLSKQGKSQWDIKTPPPLLTQSPSLSTSSRTYSCKAQMWYTIKNKKPVCIGHKHPTVSEISQPTIKQSQLIQRTAFVSPVTQSTLMPLEEIQAKRLTLTEILQLPRFTDYESGVPSRVLFIKNLSSAVKEVDLVSIFGHFEDPDSSNARIIYRLMGGRMKGQAFITFPSTEQAQKAFIQINGLQLKGKPIIIQYGRKNR